MAPETNKYNIRQIQVLNAIQARETKKEMLITWERNGGRGVGGQWKGKTRCSIFNINVPEAKNILLTQA